MSRNRAAAHFGVAISTAINWVKAFRQTGSLAPRRMGAIAPRRSPAPIEIG
jgi:putative transposase